MKVLLGLWIIILAMNGARAQDIYFKTYNTSNGLPSTQVYDIKIDRNGFLWYATDFGVGRFDGFEFINYTTEDGLPINSTVRLYEDRSGRMWFHSYAGQLSFLEGENITQCLFNEDLETFLLNSYIHEIYVDEKDNIFISPMAGGIIKCSLDGDIRHIANTYGIQDNFHLFINDLGDQIFTSLLHRNDMPILLDSLKTVNQYFIPARYSFLGFHRYIVKLNDQEYIFSYCDKLYHFKEGVIYKSISFEDQVVGLMVDSQNNLWVSVLYGKGVFVYPDANIAAKPVSYLEGKTITKVIQDREGNYWFASIGEGLLFTPSLDFIIYGKTNDGHALSILSMDKYDDDLYVSTIDKTIHKFKLAGGRAVETGFNLASELTNWIFDIEVDPHGDIWLASATDMRIDSMGIPDPPDTLLTILEIEEGNDGRVLLGANLLGIYENGSLIFYPSNEFRRRIFALHEDADNTIWIGTLSGLYKFNGKDYLFMGERNPELGSRITCISSVHDYLFIGTSSGGLLIYREDSIYHVIDKNKGLVGNMINELYFDRDTILWVGTNRGLSKIIFRDLDSLRYEIENYTAIEGLPAVHVNEIVISDNYIWLGTDKGLISFDPDKVTDIRKAPPIEITGIRINDTDTVLLTEYNLKHYQNNIRVYFRSVSFKGQDNIVYRYLMRNLNDEIILTNNTYADFPNLPSGTYVFMVNASFRDGVWNETPQRITITINKHFTETAWFIILVTITGLLLLSFIIIKVMQIQRVREERKKELIVLENKFFRSQLNPHFIFNALLAIQSFIYKKQPDEAVRYLTSFARLIRYILSISDEESISLDKEIQFIRNYLELQKLRFSDKFDYSINISPEINTEMINIPPLLAQPFIENAIEHGIQYKPTRGKLDISLSTIDHKLHFQVADDGIGREASRKIYEQRRDKPRSYGISIIQQRIELMNKIMENKIDIEITDLASNGEPSGTLVIIRIPLIVSQ